LIGPDGDQLGIKAVPDALRMARGLDLDLVEVAPMANPPVCRIMDYGKFRYEEAQKAKEARRKSSNVSVKEVKFRPKIGKGDFDTKMRHLVDFIEDGHKVKVTLQFRGREMAHPELGRKILDDVITTVGPIAKVDSQARMEGRSMTLVLSPDKQAQEAIKKAAAEAAKKAEREAALSSEPLEVPAEVAENVEEVSDTTATVPSDEPSTETNISEADAATADDESPDVSGDE
jgi:translation initiation factor IF-3